MAKEFKLMDDLDMPSPEPPSSSPEDTTPPVSGPSQPDNARGIPPVAAGRTFTNSRPSMRRSPFSVRDNRGGFVGGLRGNPGGAERADAPDIESLMRSAAERAQRESSEKAQRAEEERIKRGQDEGAGAQDMESDQEPKARRGKGEEEEGNERGEQEGCGKAGAGKEGKGSQEGKENGPKGVKRNGPEGQKKCFICRCWVPEEVRF